MAGNSYALIMAGGVGSRFWPESTSETPKQFLDLIGSGKSLLRQTYDRIRKRIPSENIIILTNERYRDKVREHIPELPPENILSEPAMRNTAPAILYGINTIHARDPESTVIVLPADHFIADEDEFIRQVEKALDFASQNNALITMGIRPDEPHTGYGYIRYDATDPNEFKKVSAFVEKPDAETARAYLEAGNYLWNAGIFTGSTESFRNAYRRHLLEMFDQMEQIPYGTPEEKNKLEEIFPRLTSVSIDYGIMEKAGNVYVLPVSFGWNDLGSWDALYKQLARSADENVAVNSEIFSQNAQGNLIKTRGKKVILSGLKDYIIVESDDVLMIIPRHEAQDVKKWREQVLSRRK